MSYADSSVSGGSTDNSNGIVYPAVEMFNSGTVYEANQASMVTSIVVVFNEPVTIGSPSTAFTLALKTFDDVTDGIANDTKGDATTTVTATEPIRRRD